MGGVVQHWLSGRGDLHSGNVTSCKVDPGQCWTQRCLGSLADGG